MTVTQLLHIVKYNTYVAIQVVTFSDKLHMRENTNYCNRLVYDGLQYQIFFSIILVVNATQEWFTDPLSNEMNLQLCDLMFRPNCLMRSMPFRMS